MLIPHLIADAQVLMPVWFGLMMLAIFACIIARIVHHPRDRRLWFGFLGFVAALLACPVVVVVWLSLTTP